MKPKPATHKHAGTDEVSSLSYGGIIGVTKSLFGASITGCYYSATRRDVHDVPPQTSIKPIFE